MPYIIYLHSILRYFLLLFAVIVSLQSLMGLMGKKAFKPGNKTAALLLLIACDLQLLMGLALYFGNGWNKVLTAGGAMKNPYSRFYAMEHSLAMIIAIVLVHVGYSIVKKNTESERKFKRLFWCSFTALVIFMAMTPWTAKQVVGRPNIPHLHM
jgi:hypothetical protein